jgi:hypothetical protein
VSTLPRTCLSIRQPWAWLITRPDLTNATCREAQCKTIENRDWRSHYRGAFLIHASKALVNDKAFDGAMEVIQRGIGMGQLPESVADALRSKPFSSYELGGIVGVANLTDCVNSSRSPWFMGDWGFVLQHARALPFVPCNGTLGFFQLPAGVNVKEAA